MSVVWIVEKNPSVEGGLASSLWGDFAVRAFASLESAATFVKLKNSQCPDLVLINVPAADIKAATVKGLRAKGISLIAKGYSNPELGIRALPNWNDTFELIGQVRMLMRSAQRQKPAALSFKDISLDMDTFELVVLEGDEREHLPKKEAFILKLLLQKPGEVLSREEIKTKVWAKLVVTERTIDSHVSRLRKRLNISETTIQSIYGGGYTLV